MQNLVLQDSRQCDKHEVLVIKPLKHSPEHVAGCLHSHQPRCGGGGPIAPHGGETRASTQQLEQQEIQYLGQMAWAPQQSNSHNNNIRCVQEPPSSSHRAKAVGISSKSGRLIDLEVAWESNSWQVAHLPLQCVDIGTELSHCKLLSIIPGRAGLILFVLNLLRLGCKHT